MICELSTKLFNNLLYTTLFRMGDVSRLDIYYDPKKFLSDIEIFKNDWQKYNPSKPNIPRDGLSITSLDGSLSGVPDLHSLREYNLKNNVEITEMDCIVPTKVYPYALPYFDFIKEHICRTHVLRLPPGGYFPNHRDGGNSLGIYAFRLLVPLANCNPPNFLMTLGVNQNILRFDEGFVYLINTAVEHTVFNAASDKSAYMLVINVKLNEASINAVFKHLTVK